MLNIPLDLKECTQSEDKLTEPDTKKNSTSIDGIKMSINSYYISIEFTDTIEMLKDPLTMEKIMKEVELIKETRTVKKTRSIKKTGPIHMSILPYRKYSIPH